MLLNGTLVHKDELGCGRACPEGPDPDSPFLVDVGGGATTASATPHGDGNVHVSHALGLTTPCRLPHVSNSLSYFQVGNVGWILYSAAYTEPTVWSETVLFLEEACEWASQQVDLDVLVLTSHWDGGGNGASANSSLPGGYNLARQMSGCKAYYDAHMFKYIMGHTHCNMMDPHVEGSQAEREGSRPGDGFIIAGAGMQSDSSNWPGCNNDWGITVMDTKQGKFKFLYFKLISAEADFVQYDAVYNCIAANGWSGCTQYATTWLEVQIVKSMEPLSQKSAPLKQNTSLLLRKNG